MISITQKGQNKNVGFPTFLYCLFPTLLFYPLQGFTYRSPFYWIKPRLGLGTYLRNASEIVLFGTRGKAPVKFKAQPNWVFAPLQDHSHKPEEQYAIIERVSPGPYLELFARRRQPGWDAWGNEIDSDIIIPDYPVPKYSNKVTEGA